MSENSLPANVIATRDGYDRWADIYDGEDNPLVLLEERLVRPLFGTVARRDVADIGCGTGRHAAWLAHEGARVTAIDFSPAMLDRARSKSGTSQIRFVQHDLAEPLPLDDTSFDLVISCLVADHIENLPDYFGELRRICRPAGRVVLSVMHPAMMLRGVQARFIDPRTGERVMPQSYPNQTADYMMAAVHAGLILESVSEHAVDADLARRSPRAEKHLGWPLLLLLRFRPGTHQQRLP